MTFNIQDFLKMYLKLCLHFEAEFVLESDLVAIQGAQKVPKQLNSFKI